MSLMFQYLRTYTKKLNSIWLYIKTMRYLQQNIVVIQIYVFKPTINYYINFFKGEGRECYEVTFHYIVIVSLVIFWKKNDTFSLILSRRGSVRFKWSPEKCFHCFSCDMERGFRDLDFWWCGPSWQFLEAGNFSNESPEISKTIRKSLGQSISYKIQYSFILWYNEFMWFITLWSLTSLSILSSWRDIHLT